MTRLFLRFYIGVLFILVTAWFVQSTVIRQRSDEQNVRVIQQAFAGPLRVARDTLESPEQSREDALAYLQARYEFPVTVRPLEEVPLSEEPEQYLTEASAQGAVDDVQLYLDEGRLYVAILLTDGDHLLSFGPLPSFVGPGQAEIFLGLGIILMAAAIAIAFLLRPVARQLREVERTASAIADGDLAARIDAARVPKGQQLADAFNTMADRTETLLRTQQELLQAVSHELRTPLARMRFAIDLIATAKDEQERARRLEALDVATEELNELVGELLSYVRMETTEVRPEVQRLRVADQLHELREKYAPLYPETQWECDLADPPDAAVLVDPSDFQRAIGNLMANAGRFASRCVRIHVRCDGEHVAIDVDDDGPGIPAEVRGDVLKPFVRLDLHEGESSPEIDRPGDRTGSARSRGAGHGTGRGVGLGLALVQRIVSRYRGHVLIDDSPLGGCRVRTIWPSAAADTERIQN